MTYFKLTLIYLYRPWLRINFKICFFPHILILIIDTFDFCADHILSHFKYKDAVELNEQDVYSKNFSHYIYFIHKEKIENIECVKYYFNEIFEVIDDKVFYVNKKKGTWKIYEIKEKRLVYKQNVDVEENKSLDKSDFLPHLKADSVNVQFPDIDNEEL